MTDILSSGWIFQVLYSYIIHLNIKLLMSFPNFKALLFFHQVFISYYLSVFATVASIEAL